jgi:peptidoglycan/xylan/chitin deacetylase (PgdA/CDA1 family)
MVSLPTRSAHPRNMIICFDFEGAYGMPHDVPYDVVSAGHRILERLAAFGMPAVFFVVGRLAEEHPGLVGEIARAGHEIGLHGYDHDDLAGYDAGRLSALDRDLARVETLIGDITGSRPIGFRAPYLLGPRFYRREVYDLLADHGYRWVSNREIRYPVELLRPDRLPLPRGSRHVPAAAAARVARSRLMLAGLNAGLVTRETFAGSAPGRLRWLLAGRAPFPRGRLAEIPLYAPLDCDLLGLPAPGQDTAPYLLAYAGSALRDAVAQPAAAAMITFHDWIVTGGNRLVLLDEVLGAAAETGLQVATIAGSARWLAEPTTGLATGPTTPGDIGAAPAAADTTSAERR